MVVVLGQMAVGDDAARVERLRERIDRAGDGLRRIPQRVDDPLISYQEAREVSYVADTLSVSPLRTATRQPGFVNVIEVSHETAPAGS